MMRKVKNWLLEEEAGQGMVEYAMLLAGIAMLSFMALKPIGGKLVDFFNKVEQGFNT